MLKFKDGVQPPAYIILICIGNVAQRRGITLTITSGLDGKHSQWSGHYQLRCIDVRTKDIPDSQKNAIRDDIRVEMQRFFPAERVYVEIHNEGTNNEHLHAQFK